MSSDRRDLAVICGATGGIGSAISARLSSMDYRLLLVGQNEARLEQLRATLGQTHAEFVVGTMDSEQGIDDLSRTLRRRAQGTKLLVHAGGLYVKGRAEDLTAAALQRTWAVNAMAPFLLTKALADELRANRADVVFINSSVVQRAVPELAAYSASKNALKSFADTLRAELNADGVRVLSIYPGRTASPMQQNVRLLEGRPYDPDSLIQPETIADLLVSIVSLPHTAEVTDVYLRPTAKTD